jgi:hypothetical protein
MWVDYNPKKISTLIEFLRRANSKGKHFGKGLPGFVKIWPGLKVDGIT